MNRTSHPHYSPFRSCIQELQYAYADAGDTSKYRFGFNNQEQDKELGEYYAFEYRMHDARLGRFLSVDPLFADFPYYSPYQFASNCPILARDLEGLETELKLNMTEQPDNWSLLQNENLDQTTQLGSYNNKDIFISSTSDVCINEEENNFPPWMYYVFREAITAKGLNETQYPLNDMIKGYFKSIGTNYNYKTPWCSAFANYAIMQAGYPGTNSAGSLSFSWSKNFLKIDEPVFGCIVVFKNYNLNDGKPNGQGHVGFFVGYTKSNEMIILGGNQGNKIRYSSRNEGSNNYISLGIDQRFHGFYLPIKYNQASNIPQIEIFNIDILNSYLNTNSNDNGQSR